LYDRLKAFASMAHKDVQLRRVVTQVDGLFEAVLEEFGRCPGKCEWRYVECHAFLGVADGMEYMSEVEDPRVPEKGKRFAFTADLAWHALHYALLGNGAYVSHHTLKPFNGTGPSDVAWSIASSLDAFWQMPNRMRLRHELEYNSDMDEDGAAAERSDSPVADSGTGAGVAAATQQSAGSPPEDAPVSSTGKKKKTKQQRKVARRAAAAAGNGQDAAAATQSAAAGSSPPAADSGTGADVAAATQQSAGSPPEDAPMAAAEAGQGAAAAMQSAAAGSSLPAADSGTGAGVAAATQQSASSPPEDVPMTATAKAEASGAPVSPETPSAASINSLAGQVKQSGSGQTHGSAKGRKSGAQRRKMKRADSKATSSTAEPDKVNTNQTTIPGQQGSTTQSGPERSEVQAKCEKGWSKVATAKGKGAAATQRTRSTTRPGPVYRNLGGLPVVAGVPEKASATMAAAAAGGVTGGKAADTIASFILLAISALQSILAQSAGGSGGGGGVQVAA
jgi:hypothetical protein